MTTEQLPKFSWEHDGTTHEDYTVDCPWGIYYKLQATRDAEGNCSGGLNDFYGRTCGRQWGGQGAKYYCRIVYSDGREEHVSPPGDSRTEPYAAFLEHKKLMFDEGSW